MKKVWIWVLLLAWSLPLMAQDANRTKTPEERAALKAKKISERYQLSADQQARLQPELLKTEQLIANKKELAREAKLASESARAEQNAAILAVMTPEQKKQYEADQARVKEKQKERKKAAWHKRHQKHP